MKTKRIVYNKGLTPLTTGIVYNKGLERGATRFKSASNIQSLSLLTHFNFHTLI